MKITRNKKRMIHKIKNQVKGWAENGHTEYTVEKIHRQKLFLSAELTCKKQYKVFKFLSIILKVV
jgi:hypothetical protein